MSLLDPKPKALIRFHFCMMIVWAILLIPTLLWWKESILWILIVSLYANWIGHFSAMDAARAEEKSENNG
jgi:hypothetical protein